MESNCYLIAFGNCVCEIRRAMKKNQVEFYNYLYPDNDKTEENIKKKMNAIENGKQKSLDLDFVLTMCHKCDVSADYIFSLRNDYSNYDLEFVCGYTGLEEKAVKQLHEWKMASDNGADLSMIGEVSIGVDVDEQIKRTYAKQSGVLFLRIINYLFKDGVRKDRRFPGGKKRFSNLSLLHSIYMLSMSEPELLAGKCADNQETPYSYGIDINANSSTNDVLYLDPSYGLGLQDSNKVWYPVNIREVYRQIAKKQLDEDLDWLIEQVQEENERLRS